MELLEYHHLLQGLRLLRIQLMQLQLQPQAKTNPMLGLQLKLDASGAGA